MSDLLNNKLNINQIIQNIKLKTKEANKLNLEIINSQCQELKQSQIQKINIPSKEQLIEMLLEEEKIRFSNEYISECDRVASEPNGWLRISEQKQYEIAKKFGFTSDIELDIAVNHMRRARYLYPEEELFKTIPVYVRNNLAQQTKYICGDIVPNLTIHQIDDLKELNLYNILNPIKTNILIASSHT
jgi:hypothetical protein